MLIALLTAGFVATFAVSTVLFVQAMLARAEVRTYERKRSIAELGRTRGGVVTPLLVARELHISPLEADRLLRSMVDDVYLIMEIDVQEGELRYVFPAIAQPRGQSFRG